MKYLLILLATFMSYLSFGQIDYDKAMDKESGMMLMKGTINFHELMAEPSFEWFRKGTEEYKPNAVAIEALSGHLQEYNLVVVLGTWCEDSHKLVPKLYKILQLTQYPMDKVKLIAVDRAKEGKNGEHRKYAAMLIPNFIVYREEQEIGRIVESVSSSLEQELLKLVSEK